MALVLGAGGAVASAFHAGVLAALHDTIGIDPRDADLIVGTSAGASTAGTLRAGLSGADHLARQVGGDISPDGRRVLDRMVTPLSFDRGQLPGPRPLSVGMATRAWSWRGGLRPGLVLAGMGGRGRAATDALAGRSAELHPSWPSSTWVCAVRVRDGARVVFGRDDAVATFGTAVAASSAIPGEMEPVSIGSTSYLDGATFSPTNADLVAGAGFDVIVVSSPMSADAAAGSFRAIGAARWWHRRLLSRELAGVETSTVQLRVEPSAAMLATMSASRQDAAQLRRVAEQAHELARVAFVPNRSLDRALPGQDPRSMLRG